MSKFRFTIVPGSDNKYAVLHREKTAVAYASSLALAPQSADSEQVKYFIGKLTGALSLTIGTAAAYDDDEVTVVLLADGSNRVVTFSTGFTSTGTATVLANKTATVTFVYNSTLGVYIEKSRFVQS